MDQQPSLERVLELLETLREALKALQTNPIFTSYKSCTTPIITLLDHETKADSLLSKIPSLFKLSQLLRDLKTLLEKLEKLQDYGLKSLIRRQITSYKISQVAYAVEAEIKSFMDRMSVENLVKTLEEEEESENESEEKVRVLIDFIKRVSQGFDIDFQDLVLKAKVFSILEMLVCDPNCSKQVREHAALAIDALASFNRNVFVGLVLMGPTIEALLSMDSSTSIQVLCSLITLIRSPLIDEIHARGEIPKIISFLSSEDLSIQVAAMDCICQIAYLGRWEVIEAMLEEGLINKLMELQRSKHGNNLIKTNQSSDSDSAVICEEDAESDNTTESEDDKKMENGPFADCVVRFAVLVEVGEGLSPKEKKEVKLEILKRVREASASEAETATIVAEVLWGSSP